MVKAFDKIKNYFTNDDAKFLVEISISLDHVNCFELNLKFIKLMTNLVDIIIHLIMSLEKCAEDKDKTGISITNSTAIKNVINEFLYHKDYIELKNLADAFEILHTANFDLKVCFYESSFKYNMPRYIINSCRTLDKNSLHLLKKIYTHYFDENLLRDYDTVELCEQLILKKFISFSDIINNFNLETARLFSLFRLWVDSKLDTSSCHSDAVKEFDADLKIIINEDHKNEFCETFCQKLSSNCKRFYKNLFELIVTFERCQSDLLKGCYINLCYIEILDDKNEYKINRLFDLQDRNPDCQLLTNLTFYRMTLSNNKEVTLNDIRINLLTNPSQQFLWYNLIKFQTHLRGIEYFNKVVDAIESVIFKIIGGNLNISDYLNLKSQNDHEKQIFFYYISNVIKIKDIDLEDNFFTTMNLKLNEIDNILNYINILRTYIDIFCNDLEDKDELENLFQVSTQDYLNTNLSDFQLSNEIKPFVELVFKISPVINSLTYKNYYLQKEKVKAGQFVMANAIEISLNAYDNMANSFTRLFANLREVKIRHLKKLISPTHFEIELGIIYYMINPDLDDFNLFRNCLNLLNEKENFLSFSNSLSKLNNFMFVEDRILEICSNFKDFNENLNQKSIGEFIEIYTE